MHSFKDVVKLREKYIDIGIWVTQRECAKLAGVGLRTWQRYEADPELTTHANPIADSTYVYVRDKLIERYGHV